MARKNRKNKDRIISFILIFVLPAILTVIAVNFIDYAKLISEGYNGVAVLGTMVGIWAAMLGFMITSLSIIMSLGDGEFIKVLRGTKHFKTIKIIVFLTCVMLFCATAFGTVVVCVNLWVQLCFFLLLYFLFGTGIAIVLSMSFMFFIIMNSND